MKPMSEARTPWRIESRPSDGPTVRSSSVVSDAGSEPLRRTSARSAACCGVKLPSMTPDSLIWLLMTGAETTLLSRTMARRRLTFCAGQVAELARAVRRQREADVRLAELALLHAGVLQIGAGDRNRLADGVVLDAGGAAERVFPRAGEDVDFRLHVRRNVRHRRCRRRSPARLRRGGTGAARWS